MFFKKQALMHPFCGEQRKRSSANIGVLAEIGIFFDWGCVYVSILPQTADCGSPFRECSAKMPDQLLPTSPQNTFCSPQIPWGVTATPVGFVFFGEQTGIQLQPCKLLYLCSPLKLLVAVAENPYGSGGTLAAALEGSSAPP